MMFIASAYYYVLVSMVLFAFFVFFLPLCSIFNLIRLHLNKNTLCCWHSWLVSSILRLIFFFFVMIIFYVGSSGASTNLHDLMASFFGIFIKSSVLCTRWVMLCLIATEISMITSCLLHLYFANITNNKVFYGYSVS